MIYLLKHRNQEGKEVIEKLPENYVDALLIAMKTQGNWRLFGKQNMVQEQPASLLAYSESES